MLKQDSELDTVPLINCSPWGAWQRNISNMAKTFTTYTMSTLLKFLWQCLESRLIAGYAASWIWWENHKTAESSLQGHHERCTGGWGIDQLVQNRRWCAARLYPVSSALQHLIGGRHGFSHYWGWVRSIDIRTYDQQPAVCRWHWSISRDWTWSSKSCY